MRRVRSLAAILLIVLPGCGSWSQVGKGQAEFEGDMYECMREAAPAAADMSYVGALRDACMRRKGWRRG